MSNKLEAKGTYIGTIVEGGAGVTKNGFPQAVLRLRADQKYADSPEELKHYGLDANAYVDFSTFDEEILAYLVLFNNKDAFNDQTKLLNYDQVKVATGWDGADFGTLKDTVGKQVLFRVEEKEYNGKTSLQVSWLDRADANPEKSLKVLDAKDISALNKKLQVSKAPIKAVSAAAAKASVPVGKPKANAAPAVASTKTPMGAPAKAPSAPTTSPPKTSRSSTCTKQEAWDYLCKNKGANTDNEVGDAWGSALGEVIETLGTTEDELDEAGWAKVRDIVVKDLAL